MERVDRRPLIPTGPVPPSPALPEHDDVALVQAREGVWYGYHARPAGDHVEVVAAVQLARVSGERERWRVQPLGSSTWWVIPDELAARMWALELASRA